jgi:hypothetical protein
MMRAFFLLSLIFVTALPLAGCGSREVETIGPATAEQAYAITVTKSLIRFNAGQPQTLIASKPILGLAEDERLVGLCYRGANRQLYALGAGGQLYRINPGLSQVSLVGRPNRLPAALRSGEVQTWSLALDPATDRLRLVSSTGNQLGLGPEAGSLPQAEPALNYEAKDRNAGRAPNVVAIAYLRGKDGSATAYGLDAKRGALVKFGASGGKLTTVGELGISGFDTALLTIADASRLGYAEIREEQRAKWYRIDLASGHASYLGTIPAEAVLVGAAIAP